jgi:hypothetical protein
MICTTRIAMHDRKKYDVTVMQTRDGSTLALFKCFIDAAKKVRAGLKVLNAGIKERRRYWHAFGGKF